MVTVTGLLIGDAPMILMFELIAMLAIVGLAFVLGRMWEVSAAGDFSAGS